MTTLTLEQALPRLVRLVYDKLAGAELQEYRLVDDDGSEVAYIVRWKRDGGGPGRDEYGTHRACLHTDGRQMLVWGHYYRSEAEAQADYSDR
jgi:hypothetical protein